MNISIRPIQLQDYNRSLLQVLRQLTVAPDIPEQAFKEFVEGLSQSHVVFVAEDQESGQVVGTGSLIVQRKLIHGLSRVGHIQDVVVDERQRGRGIGLAIVNKLTGHAETVGCYKVILDCKKSNAGFYEKAGFRVNECQMVKYF